MSWIYILLFPYSSASISLSILISFFSRLFPYRTRPLKFQSLSLPYCILFIIINKFLLNLFFSFGIIFSLFHSALVLLFAFMIIDTVSLIGITGQICSGKSTLANHLKRKYKATIINIDEINRQVLLQEDVQSEIEKQFGSEYFWYNSETKRKVLDKRKIKEEIFKDKNKRRKLEMITHSRVFMKFFQMMIEEKLIKRNKFVFVENALLLRFFVFRLLCNCIICVCLKDQEKLIERIMNRDKCEEIEARNIIKNQMSVEEFTKKSNIVMYNDDIGVDGFTKKVDEVINKLFGFQYKNVNKHQHEHYHHD